MRRAKKSTKHMSMMGEWGSKRILSHIDIDEMENAIVEEAHNESSSDSSESGGE